MYLLIPSGYCVLRRIIWYLHPTMYLLILKVTSLRSGRSFTFTSHYVSINSVTVAPNESSLSAFTSHYVSINSLNRPISLGLLILFTSHYVSINSLCVCKQSTYIKLFTSHYVSINSTATASKASK